MFRLIMIYTGLKGSNDLLLASAGRGKISKMRLESVIVLFVYMVTSLYPVATEQLPPINPDKLDPDAAHVCQDIDREAYIQRMSYKQYYQQATNTWCVAFFPGCTEYRIASRTAYRIEILYRERKRFFCCDGYKSILGHNYCVPVIHKAETLEDGIQI